MLIYFKIIFFNLKKLTEFLTKINISSNKKKKKLSIKKKQSHGKQHCYLVYQI